MTCIHSNCPTIFLHQVHSGGLGLADTFMLCTHAVSTSLTHWPFVVAKNIIFKSEVLSASILFEQPKKKGCSHGLLLV